MPRHVLLDPAAYEDIRRTVGFISRRISPTAAARWRHRIETSITRLENDAEIWPEADEAVELPRSLRCRPHGRRPHVYRILYTIDADTVRVHRIRHAAQDGLGVDDL